MSRKEAREAVFKLIYERCVIGEANDFSYQLHVDAFSGEEKSYIERVYFGTNSCWVFLEGVIKKYSAECKIDRVYVVDFAILIVATFEILFLDSVPFQVAANEAVELSKRYSTEKSYRFVNGVLSSIIKNKQDLLAEYNSDGSTAGS